MVIPELFQIKSAARSPAPIKICFLTDQKKKYAGIKHKKSANCVG